MTKKKMYPGIFIFILLLLIVQVYAGFVVDSFIGVVLSFSGIWVLGIWYMGKFKKLLSEKQLVLSNDG